jgi:ribosomal protein S21
MRIELRDGENFESLLLRFKRSVNSSNILNEYANHQAFYKKSIKRQMKSKAAKLRDTKSSKGRN